MSVHSDDRGSLSWAGNVLHAAVRFIFLWAGFPQDDDREPRTLSLDLTSKIGGKEPYPTAIGTFSDVWKCIYSVSERERRVVAIKSIRGQSDDELRDDKSRRLQSQVDVWAKLEHPNIVRVYGTTLGFGPLPSLVSRWIDGGSLTNYLNSHPDLSLQQRHTILVQVSDGLCYLHSKNIMHGDLTGANVLMDLKGNALLADFGLFPMLLEFRAAPYMSTAIGSAVRWAAPELFEIPENGDGSTVQLDLRSDIYSFGSLMLQILSGNIPYHYIKRDEQALYAIAKGTKPSRPQTSYVTDQYWAFIQKCWSSLGSNSRPSAEDISAFLKACPP